MSLLTSIILIAGILSFTALCMLVCLCCLKLNTTSKGDSMTADVGMFIVLGCYSIAAGGILGACLHFLINED